MSIAVASAAVPVPQEVPAIPLGWRALLRDRQVDRLALALALCAVPISIALSESLLVIALLARVVRIARGQAPLRVPRVFWFWLAWAVLEVFAWTLSPDPKAGWGEMRRLFLLAALFIVLPALDRAAYRVAVWQGIFLTATLSSFFLIGDFLARLIYYQRELGVSADPSLYLRTGGLLNNWMVYGTVEILVVAGFLAFWRQYPEARRRWLPVAILNALAIVLSLTRMTWIACLLLLGIDLAWRRSRWLWAIPVLPLALYLLAPGVVRSRVKESLRADHYSNLERVQMLRVGWKMVRDHPLTGVGPGRAGVVYRSYLSPGDPVPAYRGHLHNNLVQVAAEFGLPVVAAALLFVVFLFRHLIKAWKSASDRETRFLSLTALLALTGFLIAGLFDYTYGHSLALILLSFAVLSPLFPRAAGSPRSPAEVD